ncbi:MAG TPA: hypothetical protein VH374_24345 [Polyangia bacterium]|jgi:hypothetical protein|nr:hypothetical protein [Polyangia bacterium]
MHRPSVLITTLLLSSPAVVWAAPAAPETTTATATTTLTQSPSPAAAVPTLPSAPAPAEREDPGADHALLSPTALTQPGGTVTGSLYEIFGAGLSFGIVDRLQLTAIGVAPIDGYTRVVGNLKFQALRTARLRLAIDGGLTYRHGQEPYDGPPKNPPSTEAEGPETTLTPHLGATLTACLDGGCHSNLNATALARLNLENGPSSVDLYYAASLIKRMSEHTKLLLEVVANSSASAANLAITPGAALRVLWKHLSSDAGLLLVPYINNQQTTSYFPLPYISVSARL